MLRQCGVELEFQSNTDSLNLVGKLDMIENNFSGEITLLNKYIKHFFD